MADSIPNYIPENVMKASRILPFADTRIPNYLSIHPGTINSTNNKMSDKERNDIHNRALTSRNAELRRLDNAFSQGLIDYKLYDTCKYFFMNVVNDYHDTSLVDNGYFVHMNEVTNFVLNSTNKEIALKLMYRYLVLSDILVMESYSRHLSCLRNNNKIRLQDAIHQILEQPFEVNFQQIGFLFRPVERQAEIPCFKNAGNLESFLLYRRLHELREVPSVTNQDHNILLDDFITQYKAQIDVDISETKLSQSMFPR